MLVNDGNQNSATLFSVDLETGEQISDLATPQTEWPLIGGRSMASDNLAEYVLVDTGTRGILKVYLDAENLGKREQSFVPFSTSAAYPNHSLHIESGFAYLLYLNNRTQGVYAIDLKTADYVAISKSQLQ